MAIIDEAALNAIVDAWKKSSEGKRYITEQLESSGFYDEAAQLMVQEVESSASALLPSSVSGALSGSVGYSRGGFNGDAMEYTVTFSDSAATYRPSLDPGKYGGINNITLLFDEGYSSEGAQFVTGMWHGHFTRALASREGVHFIQDAVDSWNRSYGAMYGCVATIS